jgi:A/G-specific adenine glycosylase
MANTKPLGNLFDMQIDLLIDWYTRNKRDLPWRQTTDPYLIWLSEVILQQTRVAQGIGYYYRFKEQFPTVKHLAEASLDDVLSLWQGLGYYSRARNLHQAAQSIHEAGEFPDNYSKLLKIKGVGSYTAAAIASFAFDEDVAVLDGNVMRVLSRQFGFEENILSPKGKKSLQQLADQMLPNGHSSVYNQAIMELGALICKPKNPNCLFCPIAQSCRAKAENKQDKLPLRQAKLNRKSRVLNYIVFFDTKSLLMRKRTTQDIWQSLYEFCEVPEGQVESFLKDNKIEFNRLDKLLNFKHKLTHQDLHIQAWACEVSGVELLSVSLKMECFEWNELSSVAKPTAINKIIDHLV